MSNTISKKIGLYLVPKIRKSIPTKLSTVDNTLSFLKSDEPVNKTHIYLLEETTKLTRYGWTLLINREKGFQSAYVIFIQHKNHYDIIKESLSKVWGKLDIYKVIGTSDKDLITKDKNERVFCLSERPIDLTYIKAPKTAYFKRNGFVNISFISDKSGVTGSVYITNNISTQIKSLINDNRRLTRSIYRVPDVNKYAFIDNSGKPVQVNSDYKSHLYLLKSVNMLQLYSWNLIVNEDDNDDSYIIFAHTSNDYNYYKHLRKIKNKVIYQILGTSDKNIIDFDERHRKCFSYKKPFKLSYKSNYESYAKLGEVKVSYVKYNPDTPSEYYHPIYDYDLKISIDNVVKTFDTYELIVMHYRTKDRSKMQSSVNKYLLEKQIIETLNVPSLTEYFASTGPTTFLYKTICTKFDYPYGFLYTLVFSDDNSLPKYDKLLHVNSNDNYWRIKVEEQKDMDFLSSIYNDWMEKKNNNVVVGAIKFKKDVIQQKLMSGKFLKNSDHESLIKAIDDLIYCV